MQKLVNDFNELAEKFRAIGHPARLAIIDLLCHCGCRHLTVKEIYEGLKIDQPVVSRHLSIMRNNGVLKRKQKNGCVYYSLTGDKEVNCIKKCFK